MVHTPVKMKVKVSWFESQRKDTRRTDRQTDRRTGANLLASSLMRLVARSAAVAEGPRDTQQGLQLTSVTIMNINQDYK